MQSHTAVGKVSPGSSMPVWLNVLPATFPCTIFSEATSTSPSSVVHLALASDSSHERALQEGQVAANVLQPPASPQILPAAAVMGVQAVDKQTDLHGGARAVSAPKLTQKSTEGDDTAKTPSAARESRNKEAQQAQSKAGNLALLPACALRPLGGGNGGKTLEGVGGKLVPSSERQVLAEGLEHAIVVKELAGDACPTANVQIPGTLECRAPPDAMSSDIAEEHKTPGDKSTDSRLEVVDKPRQPRHLASLDQGISQDETRKRARETVKSESEQQCDREQEKCEEESARVTGRNGTCRRRQSLAVIKRKVGGGDCRVVTSRGRRMASTRGRGDVVELEEELKIDERSTTTWYRTIVACLTAERPG